MSKGDASPRIDTPLSHHSQELSRPINASKITIFKSTPTRRVKDEKNSHDGSTPSPSASASANYGSNRLLSLLRSKNERTEGPAPISATVPNEYPSTTTASSLSKIAIGPAAGIKEGNCQSARSPSGNHGERSFHGQVSNWISHEDVKPNTYSRHDSQRIDIPLLNCKISRTAPSTPSGKVKSSSNPSNTSLSGHTTGTKWAATDDAVPRAGQVFESAPNIALIPINNPSQTLTETKPSSTPTKPVVERSLIKTKTMTPAQAESSQPRSEELRQPSILHKQSPHLLDESHYFTHGSEKDVASSAENDISATRASSAPTHTVPLASNVLQSEVSVDAAKATTDKGGSVHGLQEVISTPSGTSITIEQEENNPKTDRNLRSTALNVLPQVSSKRAEHAPENLNSNPRRRGKGYSAPKVPIIIQQIPSSLTRIHSKGSAKTSGEQKTDSTHSPRQTNRPTAHTAVEQNKIKVQLPMLREAQESNQNQVPYSCLSKTYDAHQKLAPAKPFKGSQNAVPVEGRSTPVGNGKESPVRSPVDTRVSSPQVQQLIENDPLLEIRSNEVKEYQDVTNPKRKPSPQDSQLQFHKKRKINYEDGSPVMEALSNLDKPFSNATTIPQLNSAPESASKKNHLKLSSKKLSSKSSESVAREKKTVGVTSGGHKNGTPSKRVNDSATSKSGNRANVRLAVPTLISSGGKAGGRKALTDRDQESLQKDPQRATGGEKRLASEAKSPRRLRKSAKTAGNGKLRSLDNVRHTRTGAKIMNPLKPLPEAVVSAQELNYTERKANDEVLPQNKSIEDQKLESAPLLRSDDAQQIDSDKLSSGISDYLSDSFDPEGELLLAKRSNNAKVHAEKDKILSTATTSQILPRMVSETRPVHDPEASRKQIEKIVSRQVARKMASTKQLGKQLIVSLTQCGIVTHTPFGSGQNVTASNNICNINNYEVSPVLYLQHLSKRGRLEIREFTQSKIPIMQVTKSLTDASTREKLKKDCYGLLVFVDNYHYSRLTTSQKALVDQRLTFVKSVLPKLGMKLTEDMSSQVSIMIAISEVQNLEDINSVEATEAYGIQAWSYGYAVEFFKMLLGPEVLPSQILEEREEGASEVQAQQEAAPDVAEEFASSTGGDEKVREKEVIYHENTLRELVDGLADCVRSDTIDKAALESYVNEISSCVDSVVQEQLVGARLAEQFEAQNRLILAMSNELIQNQIKIASLHGRASSSEKDVETLNLKLSEERSKAQRQLLEMKSRLEGSDCEKPHVVPQQAVPQQAVPQQAVPQQAVPQQAVSQQVILEPVSSVDQSSAPVAHVEEIKGAGVLDHRVVDDIGLIRNALNKRVDRTNSVNNGQENLASSLTSRKLLSVDSVQESSSRNKLGNAMLLHNLNDAGPPTHVGWQGSLMRVLAAMNSQQEAQHVAFRSENILLREERDALRATLAGFDNILRGQQQRQSQLEEALLRERSKRRSTFETRQTTAVAGSLEIEDERDALKSRLIGYDNIMRDQQLRLSLLETALQREKLTRKALQARLQTFAHGLVSEDEADA
ncbi:LAQU0S24e01090g1_1 [Lachancea quebecensis]|uniref:LAQU0S24e01090g1_1 n=1 Tax=Lachancea quebecensis TaxID=1654605 RepID=A0A0P1L5N6_9SACH|nr:LAQU0S24e01090g1_1 [Lachancea quebecensis]